MAAAREGEEEQEREGSSLKALAESKFTISNDPKSALKYAKRAQRLYPKLEGISETVTSLTVLCASDYYRVLGVEPFSDINTIKKHYKNLALLLHPDKNRHVASEEAFKLVGEAFRILSDKSKKKDYDANLRNGTFWTACSTCRMLHQFERRYVGQNLVCPSCNKSFKAFETVQDAEEIETLGEFVLRKKKKMGGVEKAKGEVGSEKGGKFKSRIEDGEVGGVGGRLRGGGLRKSIWIGEVLERFKLGKIRTGEEMMTLDEFPSQVKKKKMMKNKEEEGKTDKRRGTKSRGALRHEGPMGTTSCVRHWRFWRHIINCVT